MEKTIRIKTNKLDQNLKECLGRINPNQKIINIDTKGNVCGKDDVKPNRIESKISVGQYIVWSEYFSHNLSSKNNNNGNVAKTNWNCKNPFLPIKIAQ